MQLIFNTLVLPYSVRELSMIIQGCDVVSDICHLFLGLGMIDDGFHHSNPLEAFPAGSYFNILYHCRAYIRVFQLCHDLFRSKVFGILVNRNGTGLLMFHPKQFIQT